MITYSKRCLAIIGIFVFSIMNLFSQESDKQIKKVHLIFKTHLDIGFTKLSSQVERQYIDEFIPNTLNIIEQLKAEQVEERYVWTTGSWLIWEFLHQASPEAVKKLEEAIRQGNIVWNSVPYTVESEMMSRELFAACLQRSQQLDQRFGKKTVAAKMTDVPGHTRSIVTPLYDAGITMLHIGVNSSSAVPGVPPVCRWRNTDGKEIVLLYQGTYGEDMVLPDGETVLSVNFTSDNHGPHSIARIKDIYAAARAKYPNAKIAATSLNEVAMDLQTMTSRIPIITSEIGDTWIYGFGSSPLRIARYRALSRLYTQWVQNGKLDGNSPASVDFAVRLGMIAEHTWGLDVKSHLKNWDKYDVDVFNASRNMQPFRRMEQSWAEVDENVDKAIALLPQSLQKEAFEELKKIENPEACSFKKSKDNNTTYNTEVEALKMLRSHNISVNEHGICNMQFNSINVLFGELVYQTYSAEDYTAYRNAYSRHQRDWVLRDFGKPGLENTKAKSVTVDKPYIRYSNMTKNGKNVMIQSELQFPDNKDIDPRVLPESIFVEYIIPESGKSVEMRVTFVNKPAVRLPEAYMLSIVPSDIQRILVEKTGFMVDVSDVVPGGNRQMHAIDNHIDIVTGKGTVRITSPDAPLAVIGERNMLNYSLKLPELNKGVHFCLFNNLWGTNFSMWWEGSISYRFIIEVIS